MDARSSECMPYLPATARTSLTPVVFLPVSVPEASSPEHFNPNMNLRSVKYALHIDNSIGIEYGPVDRRRAHVGRRQ